MDAQILLRNDTLVAIDIHGKCFLYYTLNVLSALLNIPILNGLYISINKIVLDNITY